jgi:DNA mismatch repair protein MutL
LSSKIKILPQSLSNKIAAGEVVNRPESVVKELMENSIDSGADRITLIIKDAGKNLIQVIDNGSGMNEEDALMCFQRHSTSKINSAEDLENITTLGFRGEALASIASISQVEMKTKTAGDETGSLIRIEGNEVTGSSRSQCDTGTSISIKNLFYNTPARRNFLKSNQTEFRHIYETFIRQAISHPEIAFTFFNNDDKIFELEKEDLQTRLRNIFTQDFSDALIDVNYGNEIINVSGFISKPNFTKKAKQDQYLYLNGRYFQNRNLNYAVYTGYDELITKGNYPSFFLFLKVDPGKVDVNVHPSKMEVKFEEESAVFGFIRNAVRDSLKRSDIVFDIQFGDNLNLQGDTESFQFKGSSGTIFKKDSPGQAFEQLRKDEKPVASIHSIFEAMSPVVEKDKLDFFETRSENENIFEHKKSEDTHFNVWQYQKKYIMCQTEAGLMIIDQHAAHERILYERALNTLRSQSSFSQQLLIPINIKLSKIDSQIALSLKDELVNLGFNMKFQNDGQIEISGVPSDVKVGNENKIFQELIDQFKEYELKLNLEKRDNVAASFACRSAIKSGDKLSYHEMVGLIDELFASQMPYVCPHGRPTVIRITTDELDRRFSRT